MKQRRKRAFRVSSTYTYLKSRELEGTLGDGSRLTGSFIQTSLRVCKGWGIVSAARCEPISTWPPRALLPDLDNVARFLCTPIYVRVRNLVDMINCLTNKLPVVASFYVNLKQWRQVKGGSIGLAGALPDAAHCVLVTGCDTSQNIVSFRNSWGPGWGQAGYGTMTFDFIEKNLQEAYSVAPPENPNLVTDKAIAREYSHPLGKYECLELRDGANRESIGWIIIKRTDACLEIEDLYVRPGYRKKGFGANLFCSALGMARADGLALVGWVGLADAITRTANLREIEAMVGKFGYGLKQEKLSWSLCSIRESVLSQASILRPGVAMAPSGLFESLDDILNFGDMGK